MIACGLFGLKGLAIGYLIAWPSGAPIPGAAMLNYSAESSHVANGAIVPLSSNPEDLAVGAWMSSVHLVVDVYGYFQ